MDVVTYALAKKMCAAAASGISNIEINGTTMTMTTSLGQTFNMTFPTPADGVDGKSITGIEINEENHLICTLSDGSIIDAGTIKDVNDLTDKVNKLEEDSKLQFIM